MARSSYVEPSALGLVLAALQPANRLVFEVMLATGLRVGDVLRLTTAQIERQRFTVREQKTGKTRRVSKLAGSGFLPNYSYRFCSRPGGSTLSRAATTGASIAPDKRFGKTAPAVPGSSSTAGLCQKGRFRRIAPARSTRWTSTTAPATLTRCAKS